jgi:ribosome-binding factor A
MDPHRSRRISEAVREELAEIVNFETSDPRLLTVNITDVQVSPDLRHAQVRVAVSGGEAAERQALAGLEHAKQYFRHQLAARLNLRRVPEFHFAVDQWAEADSRVEVLLKRAKKSRGNTENTP